MQQTCPLSIFVTGQLEQLTTVQRPVTSPTCAGQVKNTVPQYRGAIPPLPCWLHGHSVNNHSRIVAITHEFSARFKAFGHDDFCWRTHLLSSIIPTFIRGYKRREAGLYVLTKTVEYGSVFVAWSRPRSQGSRIMHRRRCLTSQGDECCHSGRVVVLANHRYDSSSAHLCSSLCVSHIRSALAVRHVYSPMSVVDIVQLACVSTVELYIPSVVYSFHWRAASMLEFVHTVCSMQLQLARVVNVSSTGTSRQC